MTLVLDADQEAALRRLATRGGIPGLPELDPDRPGPWPAMDEDLYEDYLCLDQDAINRGVSVTVLEGEAGTGKTTVAGRAAKAIGGKAVLYLAKTHVAVGRIREAQGLPARSYWRPGDPIDGTEVMTVDRFLGTRLRTTGDSRFAEQLSRGGVSADKQVSGLVIVVDEHSMLAFNELRDIVLKAPDPLEKQLALLDRQGLLLDSVEGWRANLVGYYEDPDGESEYLAALALTVLSRLPVADDGATPSRRMALFSLGMWLAGRESGVDLPGSAGRLQDRLDKRPSMARVFRYARRKAKALKLRPEDIDGAESLLRALHKTGAQLSVLLVGDPFQLPCVSGREFAPYLRPTAMLTQVHRTGGGSLKEFTSEMRRRLAEGEGPRHPKRSGLRRWLLGCLGDRELDDTLEIVDETTGTEGQSSRVAEAYLDWDIGKVDDELTGAVISFKHRSRHRINRELRAHRTDTPDDPAPVQGDILLVSGRYGLSNVPRSYSPTEIGRWTAGEVYESPEISGWSADTLELDKSEALLVTSVEEHPVKLPSAEPELREWVEQHHMQSGELWAPEDARVFRVTAHRYSTKGSIGFLVVPSFLHLRTATTEDDGRIRSTLRTYLGAYGGHAWWRRSMDRSAWAFADMVVPDEGYPEIKTAWTRGVLRPIRRRSKQTQRKALKEAWVAMYQVLAKRLWRSLAWAYEDEEGWSYCPAMEVTTGPARTCHVAQGLEYDEGIVQVQSWPDLLEVGRLLYTSTTRFKKKLTLIL